MTAAAACRVLLCFWIVVGLVGTTKMLSAQDAPSSPASEAIGKLAIEHLNQMEETIRKEGGRRGRYVSLPDITSRPDFVSSAPEALRAHLTADEDKAVAGYITTVEQVNGGLNYIALVVNRETGYAFKSDDSGIILAGTSLHPETKKPSASFVHFVRAK